MGWDLVARRVTSGRVHEPVTVAEVMSLASPSPGDFTVETMVGAGGHATEFLRRTGPEGRLLGIDRDPAILEVARRALAPFGERAVLVEAESEALRGALVRSGCGAPSIVFMDLGVSSLQLDDARRGFSFSKVGPLDMRMGRQSVTASEWLSAVSAEEMERVFRAYGDEPFARRIASAVSERARRTPFRTTDELAGFVADLVPRRLRGRSPVHPATRVFQAIRIAVNDELGLLERTLPEAYDVLAPGGRLVVIAFHSGEDRIVKEFMRGLHKAGVGTRLNKKPLKASDEEVARNPRARSACVRGILKAPPPVRRKSWDIDDAEEDDA